ncbi:MAG TPA: hypothetical protein VFO60_02525 [Candidatus Dormibacteraeota bacterium]|nr:hypothetical protein [Candidatus Dormibacteraeota bacterium]
MTVDEYQIEIAQLRRELSRLKAEEAPKAIIEEYEAEVRILLALYRAALETLARGDEDPLLPAALAEIGFGEWSLSNVYSFIYEAALDAETEGRDLANLVSGTDWPGSLRIVLEN